MKKCAILSAKEVTAAPTHIADDYHPLYSVAMSEVAYSEGNEGLGEIEYSSDGALFAYNNANNGGTTVFRFPTQRANASAVSVRYRTDTKFRILPWDENAGSHENEGAYTEDDGLWHDMVISLSAYGISNIENGTLIQLLPEGGACDVGKKIQIKAINYYSSVENAELDNKINPPINEKAAFNVDKYDLDIAMKSIWDGNITYNESVMFVGKTTPQPLMFKPDCIISLRSPDLSTEYIEGVDYTVTDDGKLLLTDNTSIPFMTEDQYYPKELIPNDVFGSNLGDARPYVMFGESDTMIKWQVAVTYKHSELWHGYKPEDKSRMLPRFNKKLASGDPCTVLWYGDSITVGCNASGIVGVEPFQPIFPVMTNDHFAAVSGNDKIRYINTAVGGTGIEWGIANVKANVTDYSPDLAVIGFGMNDGLMSAEKQTEKTVQLINMIKSACPDTEIVVIATMLPNREAAGFWANQIDYEPEYLKRIEQGMGIPVVRMGTVHDELVRAKKFYHITGNNINHAGDFLVRAYAQNIAMTVTGKLNTDD